MGALTEEGRMIRDVAERLLRDIAPDADGRRHWAPIEEAGLPLMLVDQDRGGYGLSAVDACAVIALTGECAVPVPLAETIIANGLLSGAGLSPAAGAATLAPEIVDLRRDGDGWIAETTLRRVPWGRWAEPVAIGRLEGGYRLLKLPCPEPGGIVTGASLAGEPCDDIRIAARIAPEAIGAAPVASDWLRRAGAAMRAVQMAGAIQTILDMTLAHVKDRSQFGRPIGGFQAVQHQVAILASESAAATVAGDLAADALAAGLDRQAVAAAKVRTGEAAGQVARIAHQLHGAIGFTQEFRLHHYVRRLWAWRDSFGGESAWSLELGRDLAAAGGDRLWPALTEI